MHSRLPLFISAVIGIAGLGPWTAAARTSPINPDSLPGEYSRAVTTIDGGLREGRTIRVTDNSDQDGWAAAPRLDHEGRFVAFKSFDQIWVKDLKTNTIRLASASRSGVAGNSFSYAPDISGSGRFVSFLSVSSNLVPGEDHTPYLTDVFVKDLETGHIERASVSTTGLQANGASSRATISANGQFVAFTSSATNLVRNDTNAGWDIFIRNRHSGVTERVTISGHEIPGDLELPGLCCEVDVSISGDGRFLVFESVNPSLVADDFNGTYDVFLYDRQRRALTRVSRGQGANGASLNPVISADGSNRCICVRRIVRHEWRRRFHHLRPRYRHDHTRRCQLIGAAVAKSRHRMARFGVECKRAIRRISIHGIKSG